MGYIGNDPKMNETVTSAEIVDGAIVNADVSSSAAIAFSKMADLTASRLLVSDGNGDVSVSDVTSAEALLLDGGTSATSTTLAAADRLIVNDNGTIVQVALSDFETFFEGAIDTLSSAMTFSSTVTVGSDGSGQDVIFYSGTAGDNLTWDASEECLIITGTDGQTSLNVADGNLVVADNIDLEGDIDVNGTANLDVVDIDGAVDMASTLAVGDDVTISKDSADTTLTISAHHNTDATNPKLVFKKSGGTNASPTLVADGESLGKIEWQGYNDDGTGYDVGGHINFKVDATPSSSNDSSDMPTQMLIALSPDGSDTPTTRLNMLSSGSTIFYKTDGSSRQMTLDGSGNLKIESDANVYLSIDTTQSNGDEWQILNAVSGTTSGLQFKDIDTSTVVMLMQEDGKVGIGETSPQGPLHVRSADSGATVHASADEIIAEGSANAGISILTGTSDEGAIYFGDSGDNDIGRIRYAHSSNKLDFRVNALINMTLTGDQVGIGNASPTGNLEVRSAASNHCILTVNTTDANYDASIILEEAGSEKWNIMNDADGHSGGSNSFVIRDRSDSSTAVHIVPGGTSFVSGSDERLKKDINNIGSVLDGINSLRPITYKRKYGKLDITHPGLIAQEVKPHFPLAVLGEEDSFREISENEAEGGLSLAYQDLIPYLIKAVQELSAELEELKKKVK